MRVLNFGSLNYDHVYEMDHFTEPKETQSSLSYIRNFGGKGLNQSIALAKAGMEVYHAGKVGSDGQDFIDYLEKYGVRTDYLKKDDNEATGHAIIEICKGQNRIILHGGANRSVDDALVDEVLSHFGNEDLLLIQNEISDLPYLIDKAHEKGMTIAFNTAPMDAGVFEYPLDKIDIFIVNEIEGAGLAGIDSDESDTIMKALQKRFPDKKIVLTLGENGSCFIHGEQIVRQGIYKVDVVDTTAAGDTFTGFFLASYLKDKDVKKALELAAKASSITVGGKGAAMSIPEIGQL